MNTKLLKFALALLALSSTHSLKAANNLVAMPGLAGEIPLTQVKAVVPVNGDTVAAGTSRIMVSMRLGSPSAVLADGSWLYYGYVARSDPHGSGQSGTLVVRFVAKKVSSLTIADQSTIVALRSSPRHPVTDKLVAAAQRR